MDEKLKEDVLWLERVLAKFIEASEASLQNIEATLWCHEISIKNLEHQIEEILDILSKEQEEFKQATQVPYRNNMTVNNNDEVG